MTRKPEDATWIGPWEDGQRLFDGHSWTVEHTTHNGRPYPITVAVIGKQYLDGRVQRRIAVDAPGDPQVFDPEDAQESDPARRWKLTTARRGILTGRAAEI